MSRDQSDPMLCRNFRNGTCPKSDPIVLEERSDHVQFGCKTCRGGWVVTMPTGKAKARYENKLAQIKKKIERERSHEQRPRWYT